MNKRYLISLSFIIVILTTLSLSIYNIITVYNKEKFTDDISMGLFGVAFRISLLLPSIIAEISAFFDFVFLLSNRKCKTNSIYILRMIAFSISTMIIVFSTICYIGSTNKIFQILLLSSIIALLPVKAICGVLNITHREDTNKK